LAIGLKPAADWAQSMMNEIFDDILSELEVCFDDILTSHMNWDEHITVIFTVLERLDENGFTVNPAICHWAVAEAEWMG
jgi:hypothetical protein